MPSGARLDANAKALEPREEQIALGAEGALDGARLGDHMLLPSSGIAARCRGLLPPPSRNEPALASASTTRFGASVQVTRHPG